MNKNLIARLKPEGKIQIIKGEEKEIHLEIFDKGAGDTYDLTNVDEIKVFMKLNTGILVKTLTDDPEETDDGGITVVEAVKGHFKVSLQEVETATLKETEIGLIEVELVEDGVTTILHIEKAYSAKARLQ